jgi:hypothetical protein
MKKSELIQLQIEIVDLEKQIAAKQALISQYWVDAKKEALVSDKQKELVKEAAPK